MSEKLVLTATRGWDYGGIDSHQTRIGGASVNSDGETGFWRLGHNHLAAALGRHDLTGEQLRVYLALADLTYGYGKEQDVVSLGQIGERAGGLMRQHVLRAIKALALKGLYKQIKGNGQSVTRWIAWPAPAVALQGTTSRTVALQGNTHGAVAAQGSSSVASQGYRGVATHGSHQEGKKPKKNISSHQGTQSTPQAAPDSRVKTFLDFFAETYRSTTGRPYLVNGARDGATVKRLLKSLDGLDTDALAELQQAARNMLSDPWGRQRADIGLLAGKINSWRGKSQPTFTEDPQALANGRRLAAERASA